MGFKTFFTSFLYALASKKTRFVGSMSKTPQKKSHGVVVFGHSNEPRDFDVECATEVNVSQIQGGPPTSYK